jgi:hypothetical protein
VWNSVPYPALLAVTRGYVDKESHYLYNGVCVDYAGAGGPDAGWTMDVLLTATEREALNSTRRGIWIDLAGGF